ncbi:MAG: tripartite tricarboxylate transporter TctB family protein [Pseudorhodoplanes sp.]
MRANDALSGLVLIVFSLAMIALTLRFPDFPGQRYGPALFPRILATALIAGGMLLIWNGLSARRAGAPWLQIAPWARDPWRLSCFALVLVALVFYILAADAIGFIPVAIVFLGALFVWYGVKPLAAAVTAVVATIAIHWFFATMLRVPLPRGVLDSVL